MNLMDSYTDKQFREIILSSFSYADCLRKLGYSSNSGAMTKKLKEKIEKLQISTSHFKEKILLKEQKKMYFVKIALLLKKL